MPCESVDLETFVTRVKREHHHLMGTPVEIAVESFLNLAATLDQYGVEMFHTMNTKGKHVMVGIGPETINIYSGPQMEVQKR